MTALAAAPPSQELYASSGSLGDPMELYGQPQYGDWQPGKQLMPAYYTPQSVFNVQAAPAGYGVVQGQAQVAVQGQVQGAAVVQAQPVKQVQIEPPRGREMTPEECAARGLPVGSRVIGPVSRATAPVVAQAPVQQYVTVQPTQVVRPQVMQQQYVQQQYVQPQYVQPQYVQHRQAAVPAQPAAPVKGPVAQASVGASFTRRSDNMYYCDAVTPGSSAEAAGMRVGYMLEKINRARVAGQAPERVAMMLLGAEGTPVLIRFRNQSRTIIRKQIIRDCHADFPAPPPAPVAPITRSASASQYVQQQQQVQYYTEPRGYPPQPADYGYAADYGYDYYGGYYGGGYGYGYEYGPGYGPEYGYDYGPAYAYDQGYAAPAAYGGAYPSPYRVHGAYAGAHQRGYESDFGGDF